MCDLWLAAIVLLYIAGVFGVLYGLAWRYDLSHA
jgi:hypothetical protein